VKAEDWLAKEFAGTRGCQICGGSGEDPIRHARTGKVVSCRACRGEKKITQIIHTGTEEEQGKGSVVLGHKIGRYGELLTWMTPVVVLAERWRSILEDDTTYPTDDRKKRACYERMEDIDKELFGRLGWGA